MDGFRLPLPLLERLRILTTRLILVICSPVALDLSLLNMSRKRSFEKKKANRLILVVSCLSFSLYLTQFFFFQRWPRGKEKYACFRGMNNESLSQNSKRRKLHEKKARQWFSSPIQIPSSPTSSIEVMTLTPTITRSKGKGKIGKNVWDDPTTALGLAHNLITDEELKACRLFRLMD